LTQKNIHIEVREKFFDYFENSVATLSFSGYDRIFQKFKDALEKNKHSLSINVEELKIEK
jgi:hypothetical protein